MREILFRGFHPDKNGEEEVFVNGEWINGYWVYGDLIHRRIWKSDFLVIREDDSGFDNYTDYEVIPETVGQYTGLKDRNRNKIFDGDIIKSQYAFSSIVGEVKFGNFRDDDYGCDFYGYAFVSKDSTRENLVLQLYKGWKGLEIIGNVSENSELLKGENNAN